MTAPDLAEPLRTALIGDSGITASLATYKSAPAVFTRRPVPTDADFPMIVVSSDVSISDEDGINDMRPVVVRDVAVYGRNEVAQYRSVESAAYEVRDLFHRNRQSITVSNWSVVDITATGPIPAPTDDEQTVGRLITLTIRLARL